MPPATQAVSPRWYYMLQGQRQGPATITTMRQMIGTGQIRFNDMVWRDGVLEWVQAGSMPELSQMFARLNYARPGEDIGQNPGIRMAAAGWPQRMGDRGWVSGLVQRSDCLRTHLADRFNHRDPGISAGIKISTEWEGRFLDW